MTARRSGRAAQRRAQGLPDRAGQRRELGSRAERDHVARARERHLDDRFDPARAVGQNDDAVGLLIGVNRWARAWIDPLISLLYPVPKIALIPLVLLIFGLGEAGKYALIAIGVFFVMAINTQAGVRQIEPALLEAARAFRFRTGTLYRNVLLPAALPNIFAGLKLSIGIAIVLAVAAELRAANSGLGFVIWNAWETLQVERMYAALIVVSLLGYALSLAGDALERLALPWRPRA